MGNFGLIVAQNYASSYLKMLSQGGAGKKSIKITFLKFSKKSSFGPNGQFQPNGGLKLHKLIPQDSLALNRRKYPKKISLLIQKL